RDQPRGPVGLEEPDEEFEILPSRHSLVKAADLFQISRWTKYLIANEILIKEVLVLNLSFLIGGLTKVTVGHDERREQTRNRTCIAVKGNPMIHKVRDSGRRKLVIIIEACD